MKVESYPWQFSSVISVSSHEDADRCASTQTRPPGRVYGHRLDVEVASRGARELAHLGNSFATAHMSGICALILAKHPGPDPV